jgi:nitric oxide reductase NorD protein
MARSRSDKVSAPPGGDKTDGIALHLDTDARFSLLAHAVAGRKVVVVRGHEERPWSDGERVYVGDVDDESVVRDGLVIQAALLSAGSLHPRVLARLAGNRGRRLRYLTLESMRAVELMRAVVPRRVGERVNDLYGGRVATTREESLARACDASEPVPEAPAWLGTIKPGRVIMSSAIGRIGPTTGDDHVAADQPDLRELDDEEDAEETRLSKLFDAPVSPGPVARYLQKLLGMGRMPGVDSVGGGEQPTSGRRAGRASQASRVVARAEGLSMNLDVYPSGRVYPEWDVHKGIYRRDWCAVAEFDPPPTERIPNRSATDNRLLQSLAQLNPALERHRRQADGDSLDLTALVDAVVARRVGADIDDGIYEMNRRTGRRLGVFILLDITGSTGGVEDTGRLFDDQRTVAASLTAAFEVLGDRVATYGFQSWGRGNVNFLRVKGFEDRFDVAAQQRLASLDPGGFTRLGAAIRHASFVLRHAAGTPNKLLIVLGDGFPYDDGYEHAYAEQDSRRALTEAIEEGVGCLHVDLHSGNDAAIARVWGSLPHVRLDDPREVSLKMTPLLNEALKAASSSRRRVERAPTG